MIDPLGLVMLSRERIEEVIEDAVARGRVTADDAQDLVGAPRRRDRSSFPIPGYEDLTAAQVQERLAALTPVELRKVRDHERRHANRKTVLAAVAEKLDKPAPA